MAHNLLVGTVPPGLGNLPFLQMYNIGFNKIHNPPDDGLSFITSLANSTRLNFLAVDGNAFKGVIPESIGNLSKKDEPICERNREVTALNNVQQQLHLGVCLSGYDPNPIRRQLLGSPRRSSPLTGFFVKKILRRNG
ncbi:hypothetical protein ACET3Z_028608 [Daucus carota]